MDDMHEDSTQIPEFSAAVAVLVMGVTGVGKSSFISKLIGRDTGIGHDLTSYTQGVEFYSMMIKNKHVYLVDTPGFNETYRSDFEIFSEIAFILSQIYRRGMKTAGILYLHRISDNRVSGSTLRNFNLLESMCGLNAAPRVFLVTTMWDSLRGDSHEATLRESRLLTTRKLWGRFSEKGSQAKRWRGNEGSALSIVDELISLGDGEDHSPLVIQREIVDEEKPLKETTAGLGLISEYMNAENKLSQEICPAQSDESIFQHDANANLSELREGIRKIRDAQKKFKVSTRDLFAEREHSYRKLLSKMRDERQKISTELQEQRRKYQRLRDDMRSNDKLRAEHHFYWSQKRTELEHEARSGRRRRDSIEKECQIIQEGELVFNEQLSDFQSENESSMSQVSHIMQKTRKRDLLKRNLLQLVGVLAGVGLTAAGAVTGLSPLAGAGIAMTLSSASELNLSRKIRHQGPYENDHGSFVSNSSTAALNGAQLSGLFLGANN